MRVGCNVTHTVIITKQQPLAANGGKSQQQNDRANSVSYYQLQFGGSLREKPLCSAEKYKYKWQKSQAIRRSIWPKKFMHYAMSSLFQANFGFSPSPRGSGRLAKSESPIKQLTDEGLTESDLEKLQIGGG